MKTIRLTMAQALVRYLAAQRIRTDGGSEPLFHGVFAIFGHGNVAGLGEALAARPRSPADLPRAQRAGDGARGDRLRQGQPPPPADGLHDLGRPRRDQHGHRRRASRTSNRLPVLLLPGDVFASRRPDPVLQQIEDFGDPTVTANDCLRPVSRFWDRITRPEQLLASLPQAISVLLDPADCGPVTLALPQDVQAEAFDYPEAFFARARARDRAPARRPRAARRGRRAASARARRPLIVAGGGVHYSRGDRGARGVRGAARHPGRGNTGGQGHARLGPPLQRRRASA